MTQFEFRMATEKDVPKLIRFYKSTIMEVYGKILPEESLIPWVKGDRLKSEVDRLLPSIIVAEIEGKIVGTAARNDHNVALLWVHPAHHRTGIGGTLLDMVESDLKRAGYKTAELECFSDNERAMGFYLAKGWEPFYEKLDKETGALRTVLTKTLTNESGRG